MDDNISNELKRLREENVRLRALLAQHGLPVDGPKPAISSLPQLSLEEKVALFRSLFRGREDVFARRWFSDSCGFICIALPDLFQLVDYPPTII